jgi:hypothetical protein
MRWQMESRENDGAIRLEKLRAMQVRVEVFKLYMVDVYLFVGTPLQGDATLGVDRETR